MFQFFINTEVTGNSVILTGSSVNHIKNVLRMRQGDEIKVCDITGDTYITSITRIERDEVEASVILKEDRRTELFSDIVLFQGIAKGERMESIIEKTTELGVKKIVPVQMKYCVARFDEKKALHKVERYQKIALSAAKQCKRSFVPEIGNVVDFKGALEQASELSRILVPYEHAEGMEASRAAFASLQKNATIGVFIGPEGGFDESEISALIENRATVFSLGTRILRTDTAAITALSLIMYHLELL